MKWLLGFVILAALVGVVLLTADDFFRRPGPTVSVSCRITVLDQRWNDGKVKTQLIGLKCAEQPLHVFIPKYAETWSELKIGAMKQCRYNLYEGGVTGISQIDLDTFDCTRKPQNG